MLPGFSTSPCGATNISDRNSGVSGPGRLDRLDRLLAQHVGLVERGVLDVEVAVAVEHAVLEHLVAVHLVGALVDGAVPVAPARRHVGLAPQPVAVEVLADVRGAVARGLQPHRQRVLRVERLDAAVRRRVVEDAVVVAVLPGQVGGARRAAQRRGDVGAGEARARGADQLPRLRHRRHVLVGLVVGHQHDDARALERRRRRLGAQRGERERGRQDGERQREQEWAGAAD